MRAIYYDMIVQEEDLRLVQEEDIHPVQEEIPPVVQQDDILLLVQECNGFPYFSLICVRFQLLVVMG